MQPNNELGAIDSTAPTAEIGAVTRKRPPKRRTNASTRPREHLTPAEVDAVIAAARAVGRYGTRDAALILLTYRHGLRAAEAAALEWSDIDIHAGTLYTRRGKGGAPSAHPLRGCEIRALRRLDQTGRWIFQHERGGPLGRRGIHRIIARAGRLAGLPFTIHPHMLRHACGYALANAGHDTRALAGYLGHRSLNSSMRYTELAPGRFRDFFSDV